MRHFLFALCLFFGSLLYGDSPFCCRGRVDAGPAFYRIMVQENGKTTQTIDVYGARADATLLFFKKLGLCLKPFATGAGGDGAFYGYGIGLGHYTPLSDWLYVIPLIGLSWTDLRTHVDLELPTGFPPPLPPAVALKNVKERFDSNSRYVGFEVLYQALTNVWLTFDYQYAWANSKTILTHGDLPEGRLVSDGSTQGSNFAGSIDYYFPESNWSLGLAGGFNSSLDEEKFGIEGWGLKLSIGYCLK